AFDGPLGNERFATLNVTPSQGEFSLINLVPSDAAYPNKAYSMRGEMIFGTGYRAQYFLTPTVGIINPGVLVAAGQTTDIGEKLVITPGYVKGAITLTGPKPELGSFLLRGLARDADNDSDGNGIADNPRVELSGVWANGSYKKVVGASTASIGGSARTSFDGSLDLSSNVFSGNYEMALGGLNQEATIWQANELVLQFRENTALTSQTPYQFSALYIINDLLPELEIVPGETVVANHDYCFSAVKVHYRALSGNIWGPRAEIKGGFEGLDYKGKPAKYHLQYGMATGTPAYSNQGSGSTGEVVMSLPEGKYVLTPTVFTNNPSGGYSNTELPAIELDVGCGQVISLTTELQINLGFLPKETNDETITLYGSVTSDKNVTQLSYSLGNSNPIAICTNCGEDPSFSTEIKLQPGENKMLVTAVDEIGNTSTVTAFVYYRPLLEIFGCEDINVETDQPNADVAVDFDVSVGGGSGEGLDIECSYLSGSAFPMGSTTVSCIGKDSLNTTADCSFIVNVVYNEPDAEQPPVDPGCDSLTENCDPDDDPAEPSDPGSGDDSEDICQNNKIVLCHIPPGQPENEQTLSVAFSAVKAHLGHGDVLGSCEALVGKSTLNQEKSGGNDKEDGVCAGDKILVCHIPPGNSEKAHNIYIPIVALPAHFEHGDEIGQCPAAKKDGSDEKNDLAKDSDNDGVTDGQEIADGTDPNDRGSFVSYLNSPVYTLYNSALNMLNVLELVNPLAADTEVKVSLFAINGDLLYARVVTIPKENEVDLILNDMPGFKTSPYGLVKMEFAGIIDGRVYYYRPSAMGSFEYAFNVPFSNVARGVTSVGFNTFQPSSNPTEHENAVLNWLSLVNLADKPKKFTVRTYNQSGEQMSNRHVVVPALGRADIDGGHASLGSSVVGLHEIIPTDNDSPYIGQLIRYGSNAPVGQAATAFDFAFALEAKAGNGREMNIPISHKFNEDNWIELINVLDHPTKVLVRFFNADGVELWSSEVELAGHAQQHLAAFGDGLLARGETGVAVIQPTAPNSIIAQGMYYFRREADGSIAAMYGSQAREAHARPLFGSYNLFLGMENWLKITNTGEEEGEVNVTLRHLDSSDDFVLHVPPHGSALLPLHEYATYGTKADSYGLALVNGENTAKILSELLRVRYVGDTLDFASATPVR
ncbi:MAG: hypothetical protein IT291_11385, partial [Deltaproteobacteria bacterium]|nr:hypothetical protein [Deltaproteobacteria bacterium]